ncbi:CrcB protein [Mesorhizobium sp. J18]|uniref:fluoride efflux transporter CrcB n=1 Tax=Mesorhizobium sp. J18 TaxID=935263 RepID=UPI001199E015|nr:fluoride efflux transporter CrcB [Mesorhizobium sp. J18]TWG98445.1 CrcB protein [Mesorhizobium sp. J18]
MNHVLIVAAGGAIGASLRHLTNLAALRLWGPGFPWGTLAVNLVGSFVMGLFIEWLARRTGASNELRLFVATGVLGGFTTFSAFSLDFAILWERGAMGIALLYALVSVVGAILALFGAFWIVRAMA